MRQRRVDRNKQPHATTLTGGVRTALFVEPARARQRLTTQDP